jgi:light-regulated signal transduction histidine kinase (bacteriophytochrome)
MRIDGSVLDITDQWELQLVLEQQIQQRTQDLAVANEELAASNEELLATNEDYAAANQTLAVTNQDLLRSNQNLEQFAYIASHDLQEPLRKIQQFGDLLKTRLSGLISGEELTYLERMQSAAHRMSILIKDLLAFSRIATTQAITQPVLLAEVVSQALENLSMTIEESGVQLEVDDLPIVQGDRLQLSQLFENLLSNALKFRRTDPAGPFIPPQVKVQSRLLSRIDLPPSIKPARYADSYYLIEVIDNGIGFEEKYLDRIFQVFQRLHGKNEFAGTGIGLAIVQKVVTNHGGFITATGKPDQGATFCVYLPA